METDLVGEVDRPHLDWGLGQLRCRTCTGTRMWELPPYEPRVVVRRKVADRDFGEII